MIEAPDYILHRRFASNFLNSPRAGVSIECFDSTLFRRDGQCMHGQGIFSSKLKCGRGVCVPQATFEDLGVGTCSLSPLSHHEVLIRVQEQLT